MFTIETLFTGIQIALAFLLVLECVVEVSNGQPLVETGDQDWPEFEENENEAPEASASGW